MIFAKKCTKLVACDAEQCAKVVPFHAQKFAKILLSEIAQILRKKCHSAKTLTMINILYYLKGPVFVISSDFPLKVHTKCLQSVLTMVWSGPLPRSKFRIVIFYSSILYQMTALNLRYLKNRLMWPPATDDQLSQACCNLNW